MALDTEWAALPGPDEARTATIYQAHPLLGELWVCLQIAPSRMLTLAQLQAQLIKRALSLATDVLYPHNPGAIWTGAGHLAVVGRILGLDQLQFNTAWMHDDVMLDRWRTRPTDDPDALAAAGLGPLEVQLLDAR
jgi:hypothetical protein